MQYLNFVHHFIINMQTTGSIDDNHIKKLFLGRFNRIFNNINWLLRQITVKKIQIKFICQHLQLHNSGRAINVGTDHADFFLLIFFQPAAQFRHRGGFTGALQTGH